MKMYITDTITATNYLLIAITILSLRCCHKHKHYTDQIIAAACSLHALPSTVVSFV